MGGPGSGRRGNRPVLERAVRIDVAEFGRRGAFDGVGFGSFEWTNVEDLRFEFTTSPSGIVVTSPVAVTLPVVARTTATGGEYHLWRCPHCHAARKHVYVALGSDTLACRACLGLTYRRSNMSGTRVRLSAWRRNRARRRLEAVDDAADAPKARRGRRREAARVAWRHELADAEATLQEHVNADYRRFHRRLESSVLWAETRGRR